jgi:hypothetical protein
MATAEVVEVRTTQEITAQGELQEALQPVFTLPSFGGTFTVEPIPRDEFSRDLAEQRVRSLAQELLQEGAQVDVSFPEG